VVGDVTCLCTNPPFGNNITRTEKYVLDQYDLGINRTSQIVEILFIERCVQLLKPGQGRAAIIVPQSILNNPGLEYVRKWIMAHIEVLAVVELPVETFLISGREGTGTLTAILIVKRRTLNDTVEILNGEKEFPYPIYMAIANKIGYDRRGKTIYRTNDDGTDIVKDIPIMNPNNSEIMSTTKGRIIANDLPTIVKDYLKFRDCLSKGKVHFDESKGVYKIIE